jgi:hypothetical protein
MLENLRQRLQRGEGLSAEEAAALKASLDPAEVEAAEKSFGCPIEMLWMNSEVDPEAELAFLRGEGPDPWPSSS